MPRRSVWLAFCLLFALGLTSGQAPRAQAQGPVVRGPTQARLARARPYKGDLRRLPRAPIVKRELPDREDPDNNPVFFGDPIGVPERPVRTPGPKAPAPSPNITFDGLDFATWGAGHPPDTNGDVGPTYFIQTVNTSIGIFRKSDGVRVAAFDFNTFMSQGNFGNLCDTNNFGDPYVLYDTFEDRWIISDFAFSLDGSNNVINPPGSFQCFAASISGDPVSGGWNFYSINTAGGLGDYPKLGIWPDGLYMSVNMFNYPAGGAFQNVRVYAFNKAQMYAGALTMQSVSFDAPAGEFTLLPANARLQTGTPPAGSPNYFATVWNFLNIVGVWKFHVDWNSISNSTFTGPFNSQTATPWAQYSNVSTTSAPSPQNRLDTLYPRLMVQNQYSNLSGVESLWDSHTVGAGNIVTPTTSSQAAVRYYQVKVTGGSVEANASQAYSYSPEASLFRFMPSVAVDRAGNMALGYSTSNAATNPAIKYAGRLAADPVNSITQDEQLLVQGTGSQLGTCGPSACTRWGDYSAMTLDPNGCTFWYANEYYAGNGLNDLTRIGSFAFPSCTPVGGGGTVQGTVTRASDSSPINGALVQFGSRTATTNAGGFYQFQNIPAGTYSSITASFPGFNSGSASPVVVADGGTTTKDFALTTAASSGCFVDTSQTDFQTGVATNCDLTTSPGDVTLTNVPSIDQQNTTLGNSGVGITISTWGGQTFTPAVSGQLVKADINLFCSGCTGTTPNLTLSLRATSGGLPTGADLASATIPGFSSGAAVYYSATFGSPATLTSGTQYALVIRPTANPSPGTYALTRSGTATAGANVYPGGTRVSGATSGTVWSIPLTGGVSTDAGFKTYMQTGFSASGNFISSVKDANAASNRTPVWYTLSWSATVPVSTSLKFQVAATNYLTGTFNFVGPDGTGATFFTTSGASLTQFATLRYLKYKAYFATTDVTVSPTLNDVTVCYVNQDPSAVAIDTFGVSASSPGAYAPGESLIAAGAFALLGVVMFAALARIAWRRKDPRNTL